MSRVTTTEHDVQSAIFEWLAYQANRDPALKLAYAIPNGQYRPGQRPEAGLRPGAPDICIPTPRGRWHGMYLELKVGSNRPTEAQRAYLDGLSKQGYHAVCCSGFDAAIEAIEEYLSLGRRPIEVTNDQP